MFFGEDELIVELLGIFKLTRQKLYQQSNTHNYDIISLRTDGSGFFGTNDGKQFLAEKGDILYIPQNTGYYQKTEGETIIAVHFINYSFDNENTFELCPRGSGIGAEAILKQMYGLWTEKKPGYRYECTSLFYHLLYSVSKQLRADKISRSQISGDMQQAVEYIHKNYKKGKICIKQLVSNAARSETGFRREFKRLYSVSPGQYIINLRLEYAAQLLQSRLYTVAEVADKSGFEDSKYFSRVFKQKFGKTPNEYKKLDVEKTLLR